MQYNVFYGTHYFSKGYYPKKKPMTLTSKGYHEIVYPLKYFVFRARHRVPGRKGAKPLLIDLYGASNERQSYQLLPLKFKSCRYWRGIFIDLHGRIVTLKETILYLNTMLASSNEDKIEQKLTKEKLICVIQLKE